MLFNYRCRTELFVQILPRAKVSLVPFRSIYFLKLALFKKEINFLNFEEIEVFAIL